MQPVMLLGSEQVAWLGPKKRPAVVALLVLAATQVLPEFTKSKNSPCVASRQYPGQGLTVHVVDVLKVELHPLTVPVAAHAVLLFHW